MVKSSEKKKVPVIAVSMTNSDLEDLEILLKEGEFSNRSDLVRHAVQALISEHRNMERVKGIVTAVITALYYKKGQGHNISSVQHEYSDIISATVHSHSSDGRCIEVMIVTAKANVVRDFLKKLRAQKKVLKVEISLVGGST
ncbi:MAG: CopG family ribbon-helix-helix protein [Candidatus Thorarchaeota archaeon]